MIILAKVCSGCGTILQNTDPHLEGYTPDLKNDLCQRCFKIKHYGVNLPTSKVIKNEDLLLKINKRQHMILFLVDFLNIYQEIIDVYQKIKDPKILVITKSDLIPQNIKKDKMGDNIKRVYGIKEDVLMVSAQTGENINLIRDLINKHQKVDIVGFTNAGKSSLINRLAISNLTVSKDANTTLDFIEIKTEYGIIYDSPGFIPTDFVDGMIPRKKIKPIVYQLKSKYYLTFLDFKIKTDIDNNLVFYLNQNIAINKRKMGEDLPHQIKVMANSDIIIKGVGFILVKKACTININDLKYIEVRPTIIGGTNE